MRTTLLSSIVVLAAATPVLADNSPPSDTTALPTSCQWINDAQARGQAAPHQPAMIASQANCIAIAKLRDLSVEPTQEGAQAIEAAIDPSLAMLDGVIASGDLETRIVATQAKADLLQGAAVKLASALRPVGTMKGKDLVKFDKLVDQTTSLAQPFRDRSADAFQQLASLTQSGQAQMLATKDPVMDAVVHDPRLAPSRISTRERGR